MMLKLLDANGDPVAALDSGFRPEGKNANGQTVGTTAASIPLTVSVTGKDNTGKDNGISVSPPAKKPVIYPLKASPNDINNLLGTNIIDELPKETRANGTLTYTAAPPPKDPTKTVDMKSFEINLLDSTTGNPVSDPLIAEPFWHIPNAVVGTPTVSQTADFIYDTGSPYTILSQGLVNALALNPVGTFDLFGSDPETFSDLAFEGFIGSSNPGPLNIVDLPSLLLPTESGDFLSFANVLALVNPISSVTDNLFGTNVFDSAGLTVIEDFSAGTIQVAVSEPGAVSIMAFGIVLTLLGYWRTGSRAMVRP